MSGYDETKFEIDYETEFYGYHTIQLKDKKPDEIKNTDDTVITISEPITTDF